LGGGTQSPIQTGLYLLQSLLNNLTAQEGNYPLLLSGNFLLSGRLELGNIRFYPS
jgi:hypothetical protein